MLNSFAFLGLVTAIILFLVHVGFWGMTYVPVHIIVFVDIVLLSVLLVAAGICMIKGGTGRDGKGTYNGI